MITTRQYSGLFRNGFWDLLSLLLGRSAVVGSARHCCNHRAIDEAVFDQKVS